MRILFTLITVLFLLISCKDDKQTKINNYNLNISLDFPDTVYVNECYNGKINYKNDLDTITTSFDDIKKVRFLEYAFLTTKKTDYKIEYLKTIERDTFVTKNNRIIPLYNIKFDKLGQNYIDGLITDEVVIANGGKNTKGKPMDRVITNEFRLTKGVYVIERPASREVP